uniref:EB domain-containing protein n=1 Tax=Gongylonema pulchrum TaxID=637853 RepID=A0A183DXN9_9BILA
LASQAWAYFYCPAGGHTVAVGCANAQQCSPYTASPVACINNACCIAKSLPTQPLIQQTPLICYNGGVGLIAGCTTSHQCLPFTTEPVACLNGICCTVIV